MFCFVETCPKFIQKKKKMGIDIVPVGIEDLDVLRSIAIRTFTETFGPVNTEENMKIYLDESLNRETLKKEVETEGAYFYFAKCDGQIAGYLKVCVGAAQTDPMGEDAFQVERIYVIQEYQRKGIGRALLNKALELAKQFKKKFAWLGVWEYNPKALAFYKSFGFVQTGSHVFLLGTDPQTDLIFQLQLNYD